MGQREIQQRQVCIKNDEFVIENDEFCIKDDEFVRTPGRLETGLQALDVLLGHWMHC